MSSNSGPTPPSERIVGLDALRGFALLGILIINIRVFSMPEVVLFNPTAYGDFTGANFWAWFLGHVFARQKFITLFTVLFGAGVILFTRSDRKRGQSSIVLYYRRCLWLIIFGLAHAYLLWYGDILVAYGICGLAVVLLRANPPEKLARFGVALLVVPSALELISGLTDPVMLQTAWQPAETALQAEIDAYRGSWWEQMDHRASAAFERQTAGFLGFTAWRVTGSMLLGMALYKWGILTNERSVRFYRRLVLLGMASGLVLILAGVGYIHLHHWEVEAALVWRQFNYWGSLPLAGAYIGIVMLYARWRPTGVLTRALAAVGRTAFSNYILQTVLAISIFYGHGLGLFGQVTRLEALGIVVLIWAIQLPVSILWLRYFRFGPLEWLWRVLTYRSREPIRVRG